MLPVGSIWRWETDGSIGIIVSEPYKAERTYGIIEVNDVYFFDNDVKYLDIQSNTLDSMARGGTIRRLDKEDGDG